MAKAKVVTREAIAAARAKVDAYRAAHANLHAAAWQSGVPAAYTPLLTDMLTGLSSAGFVVANPSQRMAAFWQASDLQNVKDLGFASWEDFVKRASKADWEAFNKMWH
jgi:hypothetical protein